MFSSFKNLRKTCFVVLLLNLALCQPLAVFAQTVTSETTPTPALETSITPSSNTTLSLTPSESQAVSPTVIPLVTNAEASTGNKEAAITQDANNQEADDEELAPLQLGDNKAEMDAKKDMTAIVRQSKDYYCGPAALATLMTQRGDDVNEQTVVDNIDPTQMNEKQGTNLLALKNAAEKLNQKVILKNWSVDQVLSYIKDTQDPVLIHDEKPNVGGHFSVIKSYDETTGKVELSDTEAGNIKYSVEDFKHIYTGHALVIYEGELATQPDLLKSDTNNITDEEAAQIWGMYVPVYMEALKSGDREAVAAANAYISCTNSAMQISDKAARNTARAKCFSVLGKSVGDGLDAIQEALLANDYNINYYNPWDNQNEGAVGTVTILAALKNISSLQTSYIAKLNKLNTRRQELGGMTVQQAIDLNTQISSLNSQLSQLNYEKSQLVTQINSKTSTVNQLQNEINSGSFVKDGQTFQLGAVGNQVSAARSQYASLSSSLSSRLSSIDGQINSARNQINNAQNNKRNAENNANNYQNQGNSYNNTANSYSSQANNNWNRAYSYAWYRWERSYYLGQYSWNKGQEGYYRGLANTQYALASTQRWYAGNYGNDINNLNNRINQLQSDRNNAINQVNQASSEQARLQRLKDFGDAEMNRKRGVLQTLRNEISQLQPQLDQRVSKINTLNTQLATAKQKESAAKEIVTLNTDLTNTANQIDSYKSRWGFTTVSYTNTDVTEKLRQEELTFEKTQDNSAYYDATADTRGAIDRGFAPVGVSVGILSGLFKGVYGFVTGVATSLKGLGLIVISPDARTVLEENTKNIDVVASTMASGLYESLKGRGAAVIYVDDNSFISTYNAGAAVGETAFDLCTLYSPCAGGMITKGVQLAKLTVNVTSESAKTAELARLTNIIKPILESKAAKIAETVIISSNAKTIANTVIKTAVDIWENGALTRGQIADILMGNNAGKTAKTIDNFEDFTQGERALGLYDENTVTSFKTMDQLATTYQDSSKALSKLKDGIVKLDGYAGGTVKVNGVSTPIKFGTDFTKKVFEVGIRDADLTAGQIQAFADARAFAYSKNIEFVITVLKK